MSEISGLYELCIGVDSDAALKHLQSYFALFGFSTHTPSTHTLTAPESQTLYNHASGVSGIRLHHGSSDHGLIRLWRWSSCARGTGAQPLKSRGRRWGSMLTTDVYNVYHHALRAQEHDSGYRVVSADAARGVRKTLSDNYYVVAPVAFPFFSGGSGKPFFGKVPVVHEMLLSGMHATQVVYQRHDVHLPHYGKVDDDARFPCSQFNHAGLVVTGDGRELDFYADALGLRESFVSESSYDDSTDAMLDTVRGEDRVFVRAFDDPRSGGSWETARSGRLYTIRWETGEGVGDVRELSRPGCGGMSGYTYRVRELEGYHKRVRDGGARSVSEIGVNEFGERCFGFTAPDGYWWQLVEWRD